MQPGGSRSRVWSVVLVGLLVYGFGLRVHALRHWKAGLSNDESVTYMCAAGTAGIWEEHINDLRNRTITVAYMQRLYDRPPSTLFHRISLDMAQYDVHPPLYFWLLHIIHLLWGTTDITGAALNVFLGLLVLAVLLRLARQCGSSWKLALLAGVVWYLSPAAVQIDLEARPYELLALAALSSFVLGLRLIDGPRHWVTWSAFTLVNAVGLLTHLYYPFLLVPGLYLMVRRQGLERETRQYLTSLGSSLLIMLVLYPEFFEFATTYGARVRDVPEPVDHLGRMKGVAYKSMQFFTEPHAMRYFFLVLCAGALAWLWVVRHRMEGLRTWLRSKEGTAVWMTLGWWSVVTTGLFLVGTSPAQAVGEQYFSYIWPLLALVLVVVTARALPHRARAMLAALYLAQLVVSFTLAVRNSDYLKPAIPTEWNEVISGADLFLTDEAKRTAVPRIARKLPADLPLFMLGREWPDLEGLRSIAFLHLDIAAIPANPVLERLEAEGFKQNAPLRTHDRYELRSFTR